MRISVALPIVAALAAATIGSSNQAFAKPGGSGTRSELTRMVRDHRAPPVVRDHRAPPVVRDHREPPVIRDHRAPPVIRDHRAPPVVRDHRAPPVVRDHRATSPTVIDHNRRGGVVVTSGAPSKRP